MSRVILVTGCQGQVGWELVRTLAPLGTVVAVDRTRCDLSDPDAIRAVVRETRPAVIANAAAYTAVDKAETEQALARAVNGVAPGILAEEARRLGALLVHYSTDYVFDGSGTCPFDESDAPGPLGTYGRTKLEGEQAITTIGPRHFTLRTSWVYGNRGQNFLRTMLRLGAERSELRVVADQIGAPTWCRMIAEATAILVATSLRSDTESGVFHLAAGGETSWHGFARAILKRTHPAVVVHPIPSSEYPLPAARPKNSRLSPAKLRDRFGIALPDWETSLAHCLS